MASSLKCASRRGLTERFDGSIGAASVLMPFGGSTQRTPAQSMAALLPVLPGQSTDLCSVMAWGLSLIHICRGLRRKEAMNFPEPSGSSPPEKPPGRTTI